MRLRLASVALVGTVLVAGPACSSDRSDAGKGAIAVSSTSDACRVGAAQAASGNLAFAVTNEGTDVTEFYLMSDDGLRILGEVENIAPGLTRNLVVQATPGNYIALCKPGLAGDGIRTPFTVTDSGREVAGGNVSDELDQADEQYRLYVRDQVAQLVDKTHRFADLYTSGSDDQARALYADARMHWERVEPVAESFGDLDPKLDLREADLEDVDTWTGWHRIEKDLWPPASGYTALTITERTTLADQLAYMRDPDRQFIPLQSTLARNDALNEYIQHTGSAIFAIPPGISPGGYVGQALFDT